MKTKTNRTVPFKRKLDGKTNYRKRLRLLQSGKPRLVIRKTNGGLTASIARYEDQGDKIIASVTAQDLKKSGWKYHCGNMPSSYLIGLMLGKKAQGRKVSEAILDLGMQNPIAKSRLYAALAGVVDAGVAVPHSGEVLPAKERLSGDHISAYAKQLQKDNKEEYDKRFSKHVKNSADPAQISTDFDSMKKKILGN